MVGSATGCLRKSRLALALLAGLAACGSDDELKGPVSASGCPQVESEQVNSLDLQVELIGGAPAVGYIDNPLGRSLLSDRGEVYWYDEHGSVFVQREPGAAVIELLRSEQLDDSSYRHVVRGIAASADRVYVADAYELQGLDCCWYFDPPSRLLSISRRDGSVEVLLQLDDEALTPISADDQRVIVYADRRDRGYYEVPLAEPRLERLPIGAPSYAVQLHGDSLYWGSEGTPPVLLRSGFDDAQPERVMPLYPSGYERFFAVGPSSILSTAPRILPGYFYTGKDFVVNDDKGCHTLPGPRADNLIDTAIDDTHIYWYRARRPAQQTLPLEDVQLLRVDLQTGATTILSTPGFSADPDVRIQGQDESRLFVSSNGKLVALTKP